MDFEDTYGRDPSSTTTTDGATDASDSVTLPDVCDGYQSHDFLLRSIWMYGGYPILVLGTVGRSLSIDIYPTLMLLARRSPRALSLTAFLLAMSAAGLASLYVGLLPTVVSHHSCFRVALVERTSELGCRLRAAAVYFSFQLYSWMEACVAIERACAVRQPHQYRAWFTKRNSSVAVSILCAALLVASYVPFRAHGYVNRRSCTVVDADLFRWWRYAHCLTWTYGFRSPLQLASNALKTLCAICHSSLRSTICAQTAKPAAVITMLVLNRIFVVTSIAFMVADWGNLADGSRHHATVEIVWSICLLLLYLGNSLAFVVYLAVTTQFRKALAEVMAAGKVMDAGKSRIERAFSTLPCGAYRLRARSDGQNDGNRESSTDGTSNGCDV